MMNKETDNHNVYLCTVLIILPLKTGYFKLICLLFALNKSHNHRHILQSHEQTTFKYSMTTECLLLVVNILTKNSPSNFCGHLISKKRIG